PAGAPAAAHSRSAGDASRHSGQAFRLQRRLYRRTRRHAGLKGAQVGPLRQVDADELHPAQHGEQIAVGDAEVLAQQVGLAIDLLVYIAEAALEVGAGDLLPLLARGRVEEGAAGLVQLGADEVEP